MRGTGVSRFGVLLLVGVFANACQSEVGTAPSATVPDAPGPVGPASATDPPADPGTVSSGPLEREKGRLNWQRRQLSTMPDAWASRDGAQMVQLATGRILFIGGWNAYDPWGALGGSGSGNGGDRETNEVWKSDDLGITWDLLLPHDPSPPVSGPGARFPVGHTVGVVSYNGHAVLIGSDPNEPSGIYDGDVWHESDNGMTWTRVATDAPTLNRTLFMAANYKGAIYVMGGQRSLFDPTTALNDVWRSTDGGITWTRLADAPWAPRGMVYRPAEHKGKLVIVGGGRYADVPYVPQAFNGVFAFDGTSWTTVLPDGHTQFAATFYNPLVSLNGRLWLFNGYNPDQDIEFSRAMVSDNDGSAWTAFADGSGGDVSHADAVLAVNGRILRISGNLSERAVWEFIP